MLIEVYKVWEGLKGDKDFNLVSACRDIQRWKLTGILPKGIITEFAQELNDAGYPYACTLRLAENHIVDEAMSFVMCKYIMCKTLFP